MKDTFNANGRIELTWEAHSDGLGASVHAQNGDIMIALTNAFACQIAQELAAGRFTPAALNYCFAYLIRQVIGATLKCTDGKPTPDLVKVLARLSTIEDTLSMTDDAIEAELRKMLARPEVRARAEGLMPDNQTDPDLTNQTDPIPDDAVDIDDPRSTAVKTTPKQSQQPKTAKPAKPVAHSPVLRHHEPPAAAKAPRSSPAPDDRLSAISAAFKEHSKKAK